MIVFVLYSSRQDDASILDGRPLIRAGIAVPVLDRHRNSESLRSARSDAVPADAL